MGSPLFGRRLFLRGVPGLAAALLRPAAVHAEPAQAEGGRRPVLVCVNLVGGLDGMSLVVPYGEDAYYRARPRLAIPPPGRVGGALPLAGGFGLHPALEPLHGCFREGRLAVVHAVGGRHFTRSHFRARHVMHTAMPDDPAFGSIRTGWANRYAESRSSAVPEPVLFSTIDRRPAAFAGDAPVVTLSRHRLAGEEQEAYRAALHDMYRGVSDPFARAAEDALSRAEVLRQRMRAVHPRGEYSRSGRTLRAAARLILADVGAEIIWIDLTGFDTHKAQGSSSGGLATRLGGLARDLATFQSDLGAAGDDVVVVTFTEFGRTLQENGAGGTDHGTASSMLVLGGGVRGGRILGTWPGLAPDALHERRDLAITTDYRSVVAELLTGHLGLEQAHLGHVLPGFDQGSAPRLGLV